MNHWPFIVAAYAIVLGGSIALAAWAYISMRRAEAQADEITRR